MKIPNEIIPIAYSTAKKVYEDKLTQKEAKDYLSSNFKITYGSTGDYYVFFRYLIEGTGSFRKLNCPTMDYFLEKIYKDYGKEQLKISLIAFLNLIKYYEGLKKSESKSMRAIYDKYSKLI